MAPFEAGEDVKMQLIYARKAKGVAKPRMERVVVAGE